MDKVEKMKERQDAYNVRNRTRKRKRKENRRSAKQKWIHIPVAPRFEKIQTENRKGETRMDTHAEQNEDHK